MRKRMFLLIAQIFLLILMTGCYHDSGAPPVSRFEQSYDQLHLIEREKNVQKPEPVTAAWIPYCTVSELVKSSDPAQIASDIEAYLQSLADMGINTVFVHVCAFGESSYPSAYYPVLPPADRIDTIEIFRTCCEAIGLSFHAWINPLRLQTKEYMDAQPEGSLLQSWYRDPQQRKEKLSEWDGRYYLNPAAESTGAFLSDVITELITKYHPDGIHIDDYFYPTAEAAFDAEEFRQSGADDLPEWRRSNITKLVRQLYAAAHAADSEIIFSISPQGNLNENQNKQFADVPAWIQEAQTCDWIIPQLYFGYDHEKLPFDQLLREWADLPRNQNVRLMIGLAAYKVGEADSFAGSGSDEWQKSEGLLARQTADAGRYPEISGIALYHADALRSLPDSEQQALQNVLSAIRST